MPYNKKPAKRDEVSVDEFYDIIDEALDDSIEAKQWPYYPMEWVASREEWANFKAAMARWMEEMDRRAEEGFAQADAERDA